MGIDIRGAKEHNLKNIDLTIDTGLTAVTGVSGSGKTSLVFDTLYHEARRRFIDIFSLGSPSGRLRPAHVRSISGLGPAIAVSQNSLNRNPNSTLATATGLHPFLRLLYANFGIRTCPTCGNPLTLPVGDRLPEILSSKVSEERLSLHLNLVRGIPGSHATLLSSISDVVEGFCLLVDGLPWNGEPLRPDEPHDIDIVTNMSESEDYTFAREIVSIAEDLGIHGIEVHTGSRVERYSLTSICANCGGWTDELKPAYFHRACPYCRGTGCPTCNDTGLHPAASTVRWRNALLPELLRRTVDDVSSLFSTGDVSDCPSRLGYEIQRRIDALQRVGLGYIALNRESPTLSRGEAQRVRIAIAMMSRLSDILYILDEPTIGQHPVDVERFFPVLQGIGGSVVFVEHDPLAVSRADHVIDLGPGGGEHGGSIEFTGSPEELWRSDTITGRQFSRRTDPIQRLSRQPATRFLEFIGAEAHNLRSVDIQIPVGRLSVITGISGSGKSTLVEEVFLQTLRNKSPVNCREFNGPILSPVYIDQSPIGRNPRSNPATYTKLSDYLRTYFSNHSEYSPSHFSFNRKEGACIHCEGMGALEIQMRYLPSTWIPCHQCDGRRFNDDILKHRILFGDLELSIADIYDTSIEQLAEILPSSSFVSHQYAAGALHIIQALLDVGLGYLKLGQPSPTLSGGEAQRVKLARYLGKRRLSTRLILMDEPSTGLHDFDLRRLLDVMQKLVSRGATMVVIEHNRNIIESADWVVDMGPGAGPDGGLILYCGPAEGLNDHPTSKTGTALKKTIFPEPYEKSERSRHIQSSIAITGASIHNLKNIAVSIPKNAFTVITGISGSGKSSLLSDVLEAEAQRRFLESLSLYERQGIKEGPEPGVESIEGLGVTISIGPERSTFDRRATVGSATELSHHLSILFSMYGQHVCPRCVIPLKRGPELLACERCGFTKSLPKPRHFSSRNYAAACRHCHGIGSIQQPNPAKLIVDPEKPLCGGAMYSPGFFPKGYLCKPFNRGYDIVRALGKRLGFDPAKTPWNAMTGESQNAFLFGTPEMLDVEYISKSGRITHRTEQFNGFYGWIRDWDIGGTYTDTVSCPECGGSRLRPEYRSVTMGDGNTIHILNHMPLENLSDFLEQFQPDDRSSDMGQSSLKLARERLSFLRDVGLGYLHLDRVAGSLSAGEAQRIRLASLLGGGLRSLIVLLDEPSRGMHPREIKALINAIVRLRNQGNTVIVVEHDPLFITASDHIIDMGPEAGGKGGRVTATGTIEEIIHGDSLTARWISGKERIPTTRSRRAPSRWLTIIEPRSQNLAGGTIQIPLGVLTGICGVSGSGKSTLMIDTIGRALAPRKQTTSVAYEPMEPGRHDAIKNAPDRVLIVDQTRKNISRPIDYLGLRKPLRKLFLESEEALSRSIRDGDFAQKCTQCRGSGSIRIDMGFLPDIFSPCEACNESGYTGYMHEVAYHGYTLPQLLEMTTDELHELLPSESVIQPALRMMKNTGLGYLTLNQPGRSLSGGECQRMRIVRELTRRTKRDTLYILDEPTVGQHLCDIARLITILHQLVESGHSVIVIEHNPELLASCDWLIELGPGGGPHGGHIISTGTPENVAAGTTPTSPFLKNALRIEETHAQ